MLHMKKVTLQVIADELNVSKALVSKALSNDPSVNDLTKENIWKKAEEMGYRVKLARMKFSAAQTGNIAVLMPRAYLDDIEYWGKVLQGIESELNQHKFSMILSSIDLTLTSKEALPTSILEKKVDGAIVMGHLPESYIELLKDNHFPFVMLDANLMDPTIDHILANNYLGAYRATTHLLENGHRRLGFVGDKNTSWSFRERHRGFHEAIEDFTRKQSEPAQGAVIPGIGVSGTGMYVSSELPDSLEKELTGSTPLTSLFCANDLTAFEVLSVMDRLGLRCPDDVSVVGFDDLTLCEMMQPKLTTVRVPKADIGIRAVQVLLRRIENPEITPEHVLLSTQLIQRASVVKAASQE
ncbi:DNA-binding LacI/PurR family transcriptional regulator [Paenibacillus sp. PastF-1]|nr:DNA-binding LacI/PurR family transcriptional regulator [Paenibacillus sp. PastF-2]MDF9850288.1 DNA-binding LacI/PurR family transcriptional regulator [Paenibacillus sp. PastM-2]MDF9856772.1 DNA-binding LacI/PurR family transcriptional regulator [Paenibacillus sp. PastF-1]MDH6482134.1 DNA-binding LacI/PurR family transcriptional regulator [Paenibacillus sp. PastH-2]MDH6509556.1 DNA-binding LacI/PurR family transcriptional regulator [Paenibacillus sp. PastM-3]